jgi:hypothetical protein
VSTLLHATVYVLFLHNLLNALVQIANKMELQKRFPLKVYPHRITTHVSTYLVIIRCREIRPEGSVTLNTWHLLSAQVGNTSPTSGGRSVSIVRSRTQTMEFSLVLVRC